MHAQDLQRRLSAAEGEDMAYLAQVSVARYEVAARGPVMPGFVAQLDPIDPPAADRSSFGPCPTG